MKHVVSEELEHVAVSIFWPTEVAVQFGTVHHRAQLGQDTEQSRGKNTVQYFLHNIVIDH